MSMPLKDFRMGLPDVVMSVLAARAAARKTDMQTIAREVLMEFARLEMHALKVLQRGLRSNGIQPELFGDDTEDDGRMPGDAGVRRK